MLDQNFVNVVIALVVGLAILGGLGAAVYAIVRVRAASKNPTVNAVLDALLPMVYRGIVAGQNAAVDALNDLDYVLEGADKAAVANSIYNLIPDVVLVNGKPIPVTLVKQIVKPEDFARLVKNVYDETAAFIRSNAGYIEKTVRDILPDEYEGGLSDAHGDKETAPETE